MTATKDAARPTSQHRPSTSSSGQASSYRASSSSRPHSHSVSLGSLNTGNRVGRRKSSFSANGVNRAALVAAASREAGSNGLVTARPVSQGGGGLGISNMSVSPLPAAAVDFSRGLNGESRKSYTSAVIDGPSLASVKSTSRSRARRASEGSRLIKERRNTNTAAAAAAAAAAELKCETCGKGYKHGSCLQKHLWEHTPEWALTSKLLISKHAQVQLLEAASVLVNMTADKPDNSDTSSQSPAASGSSAAIDDEDSSRTSTPSQDDEYQAAKPTSFRHARRQDSYSSVFSRSYQSTAASSVPNDTGFYRQYSSTSRPSTAAGGQSYAEEQADINAAAEGLVSCSIGTPQFRPMQLSADVPPVPPLPAKFAAQASPYMRPQHDVDMSDDERKSRVRHKVLVEDEDDGMFGHMEQ